MNFRLVLSVVLIYYLVLILLTRFDNLFDKYKARIYFMNVGQGDATLLKTKAGKTVLIDGGPGAVLEQHLVDLGLFPFCNIDVVIITHPHADHLSGVTNILKKCKVSVLMFNDVDYPSKIYEDFLLDIQKNKNIKKIYSHINNGNKFVIDEINFYILWPTDLELKNFNDLNQTSIVVLIDSGNSEVLVTGDAEGVSLDKIDFTTISSFIHGDLDILKVPHHGAKAAFSVKVFELFSPTHCVISVGKNSYGHPSLDIINKMNASNCNVMRTDQKGTIEFGLN